MCDSNQYSRGSECTVQNQDKGILGLFSSAELCQAEALKFHGTKLDCDLFMYTPMFTGDKAECICCETVTGKGLPNGLWNIYSIKPKTFKAGIGLEN